MNALKMIIPAISLVVSPIINAAVTLEDTTIVSVGTYYGLFGAAGYVVNTSGGTGDCVAGEKHLYEALVPGANASTDEGKRAIMARNLSLLLTAKAAGRPITLAGNSCVDIYQVIVK